MVDLNLDKVLNVLIIKPENGQNKLVVRKYIEDQRG